MMKKPSSSLIAPRRFSEKIALRSRFVPRGDEAKRGNRRQRQGDQNVIAGKRKAEKAPGRLVTAPNMNRFQLIEQRALDAEVADRAGAVGRAGPPEPFDPGVIGAQRRADQHG